MTTTWYTADLEFGWTRAAELVGRPYNTAEEMDDDLQHRWNASVRPDDQVIVAGDFARRRAALGRVSGLNGRKALVPGNHDWSHPAHRGHRRERRRFLAAGFAEVMTTSITAVVAGTEVTVCHFPPTGESRDGIVDRYPDWRPPHTDSWVVCGHVHDRWRQRGRWINVGMDAWGGHLVPAEEIAVLIANGPADLPPLPWKKTFRALDGTLGHSEHCCMVAGEMGEMVKHGCTCGATGDRLCFP